MPLPRRCWTSNSRKFGITQPWSQPWQPNFRSLARTFVDVQPHFSTSRQRLFALKVPTATPTITEEGLVMYLYRPMELYCVIFVFVR